MMQEEEQQEEHHGRTRLQQQQQQQQQPRQRLQPQQFSRWRLGECLAVADLVPHHHRQRRDSSSSESSSSSCSLSSSSSSAYHHLTTTTNEWIVIAGIKAMVLAHHPSFSWTNRTVDYNSLARFLAGTIDTVSPSTHTALSLFCALIEDIVAVRTLAEEQLCDSTILNDDDDDDTSDDGDDDTRSVPPDNEGQERPVAAAADAIAVVALITAVNDQDDCLPGEEATTTTEPPKKDQLVDSADTAAAAAAATVASTSSAAAAAAASTSTSTMIRHDETELVRHWKDKCQRLENEKDCQDIAIGYLRDQLRQAWAENRQLVASLAAAATASSSTTTTTARMPQVLPQQPLSPHVSTNDEETDRVKALVEQSKAILMAANEDLASFPLEQHHANIDHKDNNKQQRRAPQASSPPVLNCDEALTDESEVQRAPSVVPIRKRQRAPTDVPTRKSPRGRVVKKKWEDDESESLL